MNFNRIVNISKRDFFRLHEEHRKMTEVGPMVLSRENGQDVFVLANVFDA